MPEGKDPALRATEESWQPDEPLLSMKDLLFLHVVALGEFGGSPGVRDANLIASALGSPCAGFAGERQYLTPWARAAILCWSLIANHGFVDGNKRTAVMAMGAWLRRERRNAADPPGLEIEAEQGEIYELAVGIAQGALSWKDVARWLHGHTRPHGQAAEGRSDC
jgi:death-on-curing protein